MASSLAHESIDPLVRRWRENDIFALLAEDLVCDLVKRFPARRYAAAESLFVAGEPASHLYVLLAGAVRIFHRAPDGRETVVKLLGAPCVFGDVEMISGVPFLESVSAFDGAELAKVPRDVYLALLKAHPEAMWAQLKHASDKFCVAIHNQRQCFDTLEERIANTLLSFCDFFGRERGEEIVIDHPLSQKDIARSLAVGQRSVASVLGTWRKERIVGKQGARMVVEKPDVLRALAKPMGQGISYRMGLSLERLGRAGKECTGTLQRMDGGGAAVAVESDLSVGTDPLCGYPVRGDGISELHCRLFRGPTGHRYWISDLGSETGTWVNGERVQRQVLRDGDEIVIGNIALRFSISA